jgi:hypothetical protein
VLVSVGEGVAVGVLVAVDVAVDVADPVTVNGMSSVPLVEIVRIVELAGAFAGTFVVIVPAPLVLVSPSPTVWNVDPIFH